MSFFADFRSKFTPGNHSRTSSGLTIPSNLGIKKVAPQSPRYWHNPANGAIEGLLVEDTAQNNLTEANDLTAGTEYFYTGVTHNANITNSEIPGDDSTTCDGFTVDNTNAIHIFQAQDNTTTNTNTIHQFGGWFLPFGDASYDWIRIIAQSANGWESTIEVMIQLSTGQVSVNTGTPLYYEIVPVILSTGEKPWYFFRVLHKSNSTQEARQFRIIYTDDYENDTYQGDGSSQLWLYGLNIQPNSLRMPLANDGGSDSVSADEYSIDYAFDGNNSLLVVTGRLGYIDTNGMLLAFMRSKATAAQSVAIAAMQDGSVRVNTIRSGSINMTLDSDTSIVESGGRFGLALSYEMGINRVRLSINGSSVYTGEPTDTLDDSMSGVIFTDASIYHTFDRFSGVLSMVRGGSEVATDNELKALSRI